MFGLVHFCLVDVVDDRISGFVFEFLGEALRASVGDGCQLFQRDFGVQILFDVITAVFHEFGIAAIAFCLGNPLSKIFGKLHHRGVDRGGIAHAVCLLDVDVRDGTGGFVTQPACDRCP